MKTEAQRLSHPLLTDLPLPDAVILADGDFPTAPQPLALLRQAPYVCVCDGAIRHYPQANAVVGDGDSVPPAYRNRLIHISEQADNDLTKATRHCISQGYSRIAYLGCTGRREDHTLGNISLMVRYMRDFGLRPLLVTDYGWFVPACGPADFATLPGQQVSIFNFGSTRIQSDGLQYPTYPFSEWWQGTLNQASANIVSIDADGCYMVYRTYK
jgi:thiamine pyrophosphokinase